MDKQAKPKNQILNFLPRAASAVSVSFQNPPFSPGGDKRRDNYIGKHKAYAGRGFSGPFISMIPDEARRKSKSETFETQEPTSPKVSCMGQIKHKKNIKKVKRASPPKGLKPVSDQSSSPREVRKHASMLRRIFSMTKPARKSDASSNNTVYPDRAPSLGQMKRFASGRDAFASFDWMDQIAAVEADHRDYYSDEERRDINFEEEEVIIPFSAPMTVGGRVPLKPRKEINVWKRRTTNPPSAQAEKNPPFSPGRDKRQDNYTGKHKAYAGEGFSGPIIPDEVRKKSKSETFKTQEPTSPKVSCMGQIMHKKNIKKAKRVAPSKGLKPFSDQSSSPREVKKHASKLRRIFSTAKPARKSDASSNKTDLPDRAHSLSQMKRFASSRDAFASFDWMDQIASAEADHRDYCSDEERRESDSEEEEVIIPFSAPMTVGGGVPLQPRKEINIWKRRTMNPPRPLQLNTMVGRN